MCRQLAADMGKSESLSMSPTHRSHKGLSDTQVIEAAGHEVSFHPKALHLNDVLTPKEIDDFVNNMSDEEVRSHLELSVLERCLQVEEMFCAQGAVGEDESSTIDIGTKRRYIATHKRQAEIDRIEGHAVKLKEWADTVKTGGMNPSDVESAWNFVAWDIGVVDGVLMDTSTKRALLTNHLEAAADKLFRQSTMMLAEL